MDTHVHAKLKQLQVLPSGGCDDATFLRRVYLDLTGLLPPAEKAKRLPRRPCERQAGKGD
ncbi:MAG: DUF1549 domain-containing protein [Gemmataceae bacterium]